ncbi:MAG: retropepsin-like aspartic protease family protein [Croceibacterium sp.]
MKGFFASVLAVAALVAFFVPHGATDPNKDPVAHVAAPTDRHLNMATKPAWTGGEMQLDREGDGHFYATAQVDGRDYHMLVDTGATVVALTGEDAHDMGLDWDPNALSPVARGVGGPVMGVSVTIKDMSVGDFEAHDVQAVIIPDGLGISLLGQSFLSHVPKVDIADDKLTLSS